MYFHEMSCDIYRKRYYNAHWQNEDEVNIKIRLGIPKFSSFHHCRGKPSALTVILFLALTVHESKKEPVYSATRITGE